MLSPLRGLGLNQVSSPIRASVSPPTRLGASFDASLTLYLFLCVLTAGPFFWLLIKTPKLAAQPSVYLAVAPELSGISGKYFNAFQEQDPAPQAQDEEAAQKLWAHSTQLVGLDEAETLKAGSPMKIT